MGAPNKACENQSIREKWARAPNAWETDALTCAAHGEGIGVNIYHTGAGGQVPAHVARENKSNEAEGRGRGEKGQRSG